MPHIHTEPGQHDATVSMFILRRNPRAVLFHKHKIMNRLMQPGGHIELNEHPWQTVARELEEETGFALSQLKVLQRAPIIPGLVETIHPIPVAYRSHDFPGVPHIHTDVAYGFVVDEDPIGQPGEDESQDLRWLTAAELHAVHADQVFPDSRTIALYLLNHLEDFLEYPASDFAH